MKKNVLIGLIALTLGLSLTACSKEEMPVQAEEDEVLTEVEEAEVEATAKNDAETQEKAEEAADEATEKIGLEDGVYLVKFDTDSSMFHVNETMDGKALLTVENGEGTLHLVMPSKNVLHLYSGFAADAESNEADWISPTSEEVTYSDGLTEEVFAFDVPVFVLDEEFDLALVGKKNVWYDHKVTISDPQTVEETDKVEETEASEAEGKTIEVSLEGGTGKVSLISPTGIKEITDGYLVTIEWSSKNYDYMIVDEVQYLPVAVDEHSIFEIPVKDIEKPLAVVADTVAMSTPHEIEYTITFDTNSLK